MRLEAEEIKEGSKKVGGRESESPLEMREEYHSLTGLRSGDLFLAG